MNAEVIPSGHPVFAACADGNVGEFRRFLDEGLSVYSESEAEPPLIAVACGHGRKECVDLLVEFGLDINKPFNRFGQLPLQQAISYGHDDLVRHLFEIGADVNQEDNFGCVPLRGVFGSGKIDLAKLLICNGAHVESKKSDFVQAAAQGNQIESLEFIKKHFGIESKALDSVDERMGTPLIAASKKGNYEAAQWLLAHGADKNVKDRFRKTARDWAESNGHERIVELLSGN